MKIVNLKIEIKGQQIELTLAEAQELWFDLNGLFGKTSIVNLDHLKEHSLFQPVTIPAIPIPAHTPCAHTHREYWDELGRGFYRHGPGKEVLRDEKP